MSTTERAPNIHSADRLELGDTYVWTDSEGVTHGRAKLSRLGSDIVFHAPQQVRDLIAYLAVLAGEMDAETARHQPVLLIESACSLCGATAVSGVLITIGGMTRCNNAQRCRERVAARDAETAQVTR